MGTVIAAAGHVLWLLSWHTRPPASSNHGTRDA